MSTIEQRLTKLQALVRRQLEPGERTVLTRTVPGDLATPDVSTLFLSSDECAAMEGAIEAISADARFEYLARRADEIVWRFICRAFLDRSRSHVQTFLDEHSRDPLQLTCFFGIEHLTVDKRRELLGVSLMPVDDPEVPTESAWFDLRAPVGSVAAIPASGTEYEPMKDRAAEVLDSALRVLRVALREHNMIPDEQLRFRRGTTYSFGGAIAGARRRPGEGWNLDLDDELAELAISQAVSAIEVNPSSDVHRQAALALRWIERGMFAAEHLEALLFYFFALEALLGRKSEGLKARGLAFRRAMLSVAIRGHFADPDRVYLLYEDVRSAAVHGAEAPHVSRKEARRFGWDVRRALNEYLELCETTGLRKRGKLLTALERHSDAEKMVEWLRASSAGDWDDFSLDEKRR